ncbi:MAG: 50S ribosomal protein L32 [Planctomycetota bacterium]
MAVPKRRTSRARGRKRRTHRALSAPQLVPCRHCHQMKLPHTVCTNCGSYAGRVVAPPEEEK